MNLVSPKKIFQTDSQQFICRIIVNLPKRSAIMPGNTDRHYGCRDILDFIPYGEPYGFDNLVLDLLKAEKPVNVKIFDGY